MDVDTASFIDLDRYPILAEPDAPDRVRVISELSRSFRDHGVVIADSFLTSDAVHQIAADADRLLPEAHLENVMGTAYLGLPDESYPPGHPRREPQLSLTWVLARDLVPATCPLTALFEWDPLLTFLESIIDRGPLFRMNDPLGSLNMTVMNDGHVQGWHYDSTDFVVSIAIRSSEGGGDFECVRDQRTDTDERYDEVAQVLRSDAADRIAIYPMTPGTLMVFEGRQSLHRVSPVTGDVGRVVGLLGYDTKPDTGSSDLLKLVRYGRTEPIDRGNEQ